MQQCHTAASPRDSDSAGVAIPQSTRLSADLLYTVRTHTIILSADSATKFLQCAYDEMYACPT